MLVISVENLTSSKQTNNFGIAEVIVMVRLGAGRGVVFGGDQILS